MAVNADKGGDDVPLTPKGWIKRSASLLTPRRSEAPPCHASEYTCAELEVRILRGCERLGMELNAYNQILSFQPGGPTDRHPGVKVHDRILGVDGLLLGDKMLADVLVPAEVHTFMLERWEPPTSMAPAKKLSPRTLLTLGKARANGASAHCAVATVEKEHLARHKKRDKAAAYSSSEKLE